MYEYQNHQLYQLDRYRGRSCYGHAVQAADYYLRQDLNLREIDGVVHVDTRSNADNQWTVHLRSQIDSSDHHLIIESRPSSKPLFQSCLKEAKVVPQYVCIGHKVLS